MVELPRRKSAFITSNTDLGRDKEPSQSRERGGEDVAQQSIGSHTRARAATARRGAIGGRRRKKMRTFETWVSLAGGVERDAAGAGKNLRDARRREELRIWFSGGGRETRGASAVFALPCLPPARGLENSRPPARRHVAPNYERPAIAPPPGFPTSSRLIFAARRGKGATPEKRPRSGGSEPVPVTWPRARPASAPHPELPLSDRRTTRTRKKVEIFKLDSALSCR
ncbi:hypothetical protein NL676_020033 [Syzygium grande]|nr:hypothetical protein NL676_020033 [Syzygium grande]